MKDGLDASLEIRAKTRGEETGTGRASLAKDRTENATRRSPQELIDIANQGLIEVLLLAHQDRLKKLHAQRLPGIFQEIADVLGTLEDASRHVIEHALDIAHGQKGFAGLLGLGLELPQCGALLVVFPGGIN